MTPVEGNGLNMCYCTSTLSLLKIGRKIVSTAVICLCISNGVSEYVTFTNTSNIFDCHKQLITTLIFIMFYYNIMDIHAYNCTYEW